MIESEKHKFKTKRTVEMSRSNQNRRNSGKVHKGKIKKKWTLSFWIINCKKTKPLDRKRAFIN